MAQTMEAVFYQGDDQRRLDYTPSGAAVVPGELVHLGNNLSGAVTSPEGIADGELGSVATAGVFKIKKDGVDTFSRGDKVSWDDTNHQAEPDGGINETFKLGVCVEDAAAGDDHVKVLLNKAAVV